MSSVPNFPPLSAVKDPAVRAVLQAIYDHLRVRSGEVGDGTNKYVTQTELQLALKSKT